MLHNALLKMLNSILSNFIYQHIRIIGEIIEKQSISKVHSMKLLSKNMLRLKLKRKNQRFIDSLICIFITFKFSFSNVSRKFYCLQNR